MLFHHNKSIQDAARRRFKEYADRVMSSSLASSENDSLQVTHRFGLTEATLKSAHSVDNENDILDSKAGSFLETIIEDYDGTSNEYFYNYKEGSPEEDEQLQLIRNTRSKYKKDEIRGEILHCNRCKAMFLPQEVIDMALLYHKKN